MSMSTLKYVRCRDMWIILILWVVWQLLISIDVLLLKLPYRSRKINFTFEKLLVLKFALLLFYVLLLIMINLMNSVHVMIVVWYLLTRKDWFPFKKLIRKSSCWEFRHRYRIIPQNWCLRVKYLWRGLNRILWSCLDIHLRLSVLLLSLMTDLSW